MVENIQLTASAMARLMPLYLWLAEDGRIRGIGPTLAKLFPEGLVTGQEFSSLFALARPEGPADLAALRARAGSRIHLALRRDHKVKLRGLAVELIGENAGGKDGGMFLNLSFGIGVLDAVRLHDLTDADFAPTDLAIEMLYMVEAKAAVMAEFENLNQRLQDARALAEAEALTDTLTGLCNRRALDAALMVALATVARRGPGFGLMHIDLDFFKQVNDTLGHAAGDAVLREVGRVLTSETRIGDTVARVGGDEFVIVLPQLTEVGQLGAIARRIIERLTEPIGFDDDFCKISASIGVTMSTHYVRPDADRMLSDADAALYSSKRAGRGQAQFFNPSELGKIGHPGDNAA